MTNAAIFMHPDAFNTTGKALMGRHSAGESFLKGFVQHADIDRLILWNGSPAKSATMEESLRQLVTIDKPLTWVERGNRSALKAIGCAYLPVPNVGGEAWARRIVGENAYSIAGVTHTTCTHRILDTIGELMISPTQPWDALICTSRAVKTSLEVELGGIDEFLRERFGTTKTPEIRLETIPLGVNVSDFQTSPATGKAWREKLGIPEDDIVVLYVGRFSASSKMNPVPMAMALERAAVKTKKKIHWVLSGWSGSDALDKTFHDTTREHCPHVAYHVIDGREPDTRFSIWSIADIFISLSDNIQETFGLTPVEAMAAGLPSVVSDWDGYKDTVRHGVDGFRISTYAPRPGLGRDLAYRHEFNLANYQTYVGTASQFTAVDVDEAARALLDLILSPQLRAHMGAAAKLRAQQVFDWSQVIPAYQVLWADMNARRLAAPATLQNRSQAENPWRLDPFRMFASYPTEHLTPMTIVAATPGATDAALKALLKSPLVRFGMPFLPLAHELETLVFRLAGERQMTVGDILAFYPLPRRNRIERSLLMLAKYGMVSIRARTLTIPS